MALRVERLWYAADPAMRAARAALLPATALFRAGVAARNALYDRGMLHSLAVDLPTVSVGNLSVGGTGKTPIASWMAAMLRARDARPAIILRGYGGDEIAVHRELLPDVPVVSGADRVSGIRDASLQGCDVAVLDDGFQYRRARRDEDVVLISADRWGSPQRLLPAGPWREPLTSLGRATLVIVTRKAASAEKAMTLAGSLAPRTARGAGAVVALALSALREVHGKRRVPVERLVDERVLVMAGIGDPASLVAQVTRAGGAPELVAFADHHVYAKHEVERLAARADRFDRVVCTLKDAVKLRELWPRQAAPLWYFSQRVDVEAGMDHLEALFQHLLQARRLTTTTTAGAAGVREPTT